MAQNVTIAGASYTDVPAIDVPKTGGGTASFYDTRSITYNLTGASATASPAQVVTGEGFETQIIVPEGRSFQNVTVTMDGVDITATAFKYDSYAISYSLSNATTNVSPARAIANEGLSLKINAPQGYALDTVTVTMGGVDVTASVFDFDS